MTPRKRLRTIPAGPAKRGTRLASRRGGVRAAWLLAPALVWAATATGFAIANHRAVRQLTEAAEVREVAHENRVRALTRRLVGVASHQVLEEEGLSGRLADIITRQVDLEGRQALLAAMAERALAERAIPERAAPAPAPEAVQTDRARRKPDARDGAPADGAPTARPGRSGALGTEPAPSTAHRDALTAREQFGRIEASLGRVESGQVRIVASLAAAGRATAERVRAVVADLQVPVSPPEPARPAPPSDPRDTFAKAVAQAEAALTEADHWRSVTESLPLRPPIEGAAALTSNFGMRSDPFTGGARMHAGMDFRSPVGTPVRAAAGGRVVSAGLSGGYGNLVEIDHGRDIVTRYGHLSGIAVAVDQPVPAGAVVGFVGSTGRSTGPHLHYETRLATAPVDPARFLAAGRTLSGSAAEPATEAGPETGTDAAD